LWDGATNEQRRAAIRDAFDWIWISPATCRGSAFDTGRVKLKWSNVVDRDFDQAGGRGAVTEYGEKGEIGPFLPAS
jgi:hypothetical protein